ncbi:MAG: hypothetical protein GTO14_09320 [Anaerolineales bacterium]|nr:hypothetical protein [Anaerolineales bacterium]
MDERRASKWVIASSVIGAILGSIFTCACYWIALILMLYTEFLVLDGAVHTLVGPAVFAAMGVILLIFIFIGVVFGAIIGARFGRRRSRRLGVSEKTRNDQPEG